MHMFLPMSSILCLLKENPQFEDLPRHIKETIKQTLYGVEDALTGHREPGVTEQLE